jgi:hypothetical protein
MLMQGLLLDGAERHPEKIAKSAAGTTAPLVKISHTQG